MIGILTALLSGALMSVQGVFNTQVTKATSLWVSTSFVQFSALAVCLILWAATDRQNFMTLLQVPNKWTLLGGVIVAYVIEIMGWFGVERQPLEWRRVIGMAIAIAGVVIFKW